MCYHTSPSCRGSVSSSAKYLVVGRRQILTPTPRHHQTQFHRIAEQNTVESIRRPLGSIVLLNFCLRQIGAIPSLIDRQGKRVERHASKSIPPARLKAVTPFRIVNAV